MDTDLDMDWRNKHYWIFDELSSLAQNYCQVGLAKAGVQLRRRYATMVVSHVTYQFLNKSRQNGSIKSTKRGSGYFIRNNQPVFNFVVSHIPVSFIEWHTAKKGKAPVSNRLPPKNNHFPFYISLRNPTSTNLSIGRFKPAIFVREFSLINKKSSRKNLRMKDDPGRTFICSLPIMYVICAVKAFSMASNSDWTSGLCSLDEALLPSELPDDSVRVTKRTS